MSNLSYANYYFAHCISVMSGIYDYEYIHEDDKLSRFNSELADYAIKDLEPFLDQYGEYFNLAEYPDLLEQLTEDEVEIIKPLINEDDYWQIDALLKILNERIKKQKNLSAIGREDFDGTKSWVDLYNYIIEFGMGDISDGSMLSIYVGNAKEFSQYLYHRMLDNISYDNNRYLSQFKPFKPCVEKLAKLADEGSWPGNDIQLGILLEWIDLYRCITEDY